MSLLTQESTRAAEAYAALHAVVDPELDEPITDLGFVRSLTVSSTAPVEIEVHLRLPTSFCSPNFAYLMASDSKDVRCLVHWYPWCPIVASGRLQTKDRGLEAPLRA
ncbi:iron-sulfur cluster assembly protein [Nocardioides sp.]|uniref:iron-sulfur cluster assembly protein n=1 Tax=Nocardioides sp. TaxID=35761 RepID=UPI0025E0BE3E|nr:iron-sulfur cluster assembly protein [Nocardioides sp.]